MILGGPCADPLEDTLDVGSSGLIIDHGIAHTADAITPAIVRDVPNTGFKLDTTRHTNDGKIGYCHGVSDSVPFYISGEIQLSPWCLTGLLVRHNCTNRSGNSVINVT